MLVAANGLRTWPVVLLCVDPGDHCGVSVFVSGVYVDSCHGDGYDSSFVDRCIDNALFFARQVHVPPVLVRERPPRGGAPYKGRNYAGAASVVGCRKLWQRAWQRAGAKRKLCVDVYPQSWRSQVLGITTGPMLERAELMRGSHVAGKDIQSRDEAAAVLIGEWASRASAVGLLFKKGRKS